MKDSLYESHQPILHGPEFNEERESSFVEIQSDLHQMSYNLTKIILAALIC